MKHSLSLTVAMCTLLDPASAAGETVRIAISNLAFSPAEVTAKIGDTVEWINGDFIDHTATDKGNAWDVAIAAGKSAQVKLTTPGTFAYYCKVHPPMTGTIRVDAK